MDRSHGEPRSGAWWFQTAGNQRTETGNCGTAAPQIVATWGTGARLLLVALDGVLVADEGVGSGEAGVATGGRSLGSSQHWSSVLELVQPLRVGLVRRVPEAVLLLDEVVDAGRAVLEWSAGAFNGDAALRRCLIARTTIP